MKEKISQVIVVEGRDDTANLKRYFDVETYETRGSAINEQDIARIQRLHELHGVIVFTDPDFNGGADSSHDYDGYSNSSACLPQTR